MMVPTVTRSTEEMLLLVPHSIREAAFGLGIPLWRATLSITLPSARSGIITGVMLAFARIAGETAPLIFTAFGNQFWSLTANQPIAALPLQIYTYALSPFEEWHRQAWAGALMLVLLIVGTTTLLRFVFMRRMLGEAR
jgi:phosphate transport system permease protein